MSDNEQRTEHACAPPQRNAEDGSSWSARRWDCPECGTRWIYVQRMIGRKIRGEWRQMPGQPSEVDRLRAELAETRAAGDALNAAADKVHFDHSRTPNLGELYRRQREWEAVRGEAPTESPADAMRQVNEEIARLLPPVDSEAFRARDYSVRGDAPAPAEPPAADCVHPLPAGSGECARKDYCGSGGSCQPVELPVTLSSPDDVAAGRDLSGRPLTAQDVGDAIRQWNVVPGEPHRDAFIADYLNRIARGGVDQ